MLEQGCLQAILCCASWNRLQISPAHLLDVHFTVVLFFTMSRLPLAEFLLLSQEIDTNAERDRQPQI